MKNTPRSSSLPGLGRLLREHFFAGVLVLIPLAVSAWLLGTLLGALWGLHLLLPEALRPDTPAFKALLTLGLALLGALAVSFLGWASKQYLGRKFLEMLGELIQRIPVVRSIYSALDQLLKTLASGDGSQFSRVVYVEYPRKGCWALAFVTGPVRGHAPQDGLLNLYVPTTPNPTSGFHLMVAEAEVRESHLSVENAFKTLLSLGIAQGETPFSAEASHHGR